MPKRTATDKVMQLLLRIYCKVMETSENIKSTANMDPSGMQLLKGQQRVGDGYLIL